MSTWQRLYNIFVVATVIAALIVLAAGIVTYFAEEGEWMPFLVVVGTIIGCGALAIAVISLKRRLIAWRTGRLTRSDDAPTGLGERRAY